MWRLCHLVQQLTVLVCSVCFATLQLVWDVTLHSYCLKTTHWHVLFFHSHYTLQILIGDSKVTSKLAKTIHLFLILWWCLISYFYIFSHSTVSSCCWFIFQARLLLENNSLTRFNFLLKYYPRDSNKWKLKWLVNLRKEFIFSYSKLIF